VTLAPATVNKALSALRSITEHVIERMSKVPLEFNAAKQAKFVELEDGEEKRLPFEEEELAAIFRDLIIVDSTGIGEETLFWMVLLAPFTGCRLEEIGTLRPHNIRSEQGIWFIAIERDRAQLRADQDQKEKSLKSSNADRDIPLHPVLLRSGFMTYVKRANQKVRNGCSPISRPTNLASAPIGCHGYSPAISRNAESPTTRRCSTPSDTLFAVICVVVRRRKWSTSSVVTLTAKQAVATAAAQTCGRCER